MQHTEPKSLIMRLFEEGILETPSAGNSDDLDIPSLFGADSAAKSKNRALKEPVELTENIGLKKHGFSSTLENTPSSRTKRPLSEKIGYSSSFEDRHTLGNGGHAYSEDYSEDHRQSKSTSKTSPGSLYKKRLDSKGILSSRSKNPSEPAISNAKKSSSLVTPPIQFVDYTDTFKHSRSPNAYLQSNYIPKMNSERESPLLASPKSLFGDHERPRQNDFKPSSIDDQEKFAESHYSHVAIGSEDGDGAPAKKRITNSSSKPFGDLKMAPSRSVSSLNVLSEAQSFQISKCAWGDCNLDFTTQEQLVSHLISIHLGIGKTSYTCEWKNCHHPGPFFKRYKMMNHLRIHTGERPFACDYPGCDKKFIRQDGLDAHAKVHIGVREYKCSHPQCDRSYFHPRSLKKHEKSHKEVSKEVPENEASNEGPE